LAVLRSRLELLRLLPPLLSRFDFPGLSLVVVVVLAGLSLVDF
jgi:hypothetical protein